VVFFWPIDLNFVSPTEIAEFARRDHEFVKRNTQVLGVSTDKHYVHLAWRRHNPALRDLPFPMLADFKCELSSALSILHPGERGCPARGLYHGFCRHRPVCHAERSVSQPERR
jgi:lipoyl-dependent peroxiredoxin subunit C